jgi:hypothetical protein
VLPAHPEKRREEDPTLLQSKRSMWGIDDRVKTDKRSFESRDRVGEEKAERASERKVGMEENTEESGLLSPTRFFRVLLRGSAGEETMPLRPFFLRLRNGIRKLLETA